MKFNMGAYIIDCQDCMDKGLVVNAFHVEGSNTTYLRRECVCHSNDTGHKSFSIVRVGQYETTWINGIGYIG